MNQVSRKFTVQEVKWNKWISSREKWYRNHVVFLSTGIYIGCLETIISWDENNLLTIHYSTFICCVFGVSSWKKWAVAKGKLWSPIWMMCWMQLMYNCLLFPCIVFVMFCISLLKYLLRQSKHNDAFKQLMALNKLEL